MASTPLHPNEALKPQLCPLLQDQPSPQFLPGHTLTLGPPAASTRLLRLPGDWGGAGPGQGGGGQAGTLKSSQVPPSGQHWAPTMAETAKLQLFVKVLGGGGGGGGWLGWGLRAGCSVGATVSGDRGLRVGLRGSVCAPSPGVGGRRQPYGG